MVRSQDQAAFDAYAAARWTPLVRVVALLGTPDHLAPDVVRTALARTRAEWSGRDSVDPEVTMSQALVVERQRVEKWWLTAPAAQSAADSVRADLESRLDLLTVEDRGALLIEALLGIGERFESGTSPSAQSVRAVAETIPVEPFAAGAVADAARARARLRRRRTAGSVAPIALVLSLVVGSALLNGGAADPVPEAVDTSTAPPPSPAGSRPAIAAPNPAPVPWYAQGSLHLERSRLEIPTVRGAANLRGGAVILTYDGDLSLVDDLGNLARLADLSDRGDSAAFVADGSGLVAWVESENPDPEVTEGTPFSLVVHDTTRRIDLLRLLVDAETEVVAVGARAVFFNQGKGSTEVALGREEMVVQTPRREGYVAVAPTEEDIEVDPRPLVAALATTRIYQVGSGRLEVERELGGRLRIPGFGGEISDDGRYLATRTFGDRASVYGDVRVYDLLSGEELDNGVDRRKKLTIDYELGPGDTITYLLTGIGQGRGGQIPGEEGSERLDLVTCDLPRVASEPAADRCSTHARIATSGIPSFLGQ